MTRRIEFIDLAKGFCILLVVWGHVSHTQNVEYPFASTIAMFRMPLYFFLSGLFFKTYSGFKNFLLRKTNKLLIPFSFFFITISCGVPFLNNLVSNHYLLFEPCFWNERFFSNAIWFLLALFETNILFFIIYNVSHKFSHSTFLIILFSLVVGAAGFYIGKERILLPMFIDTAMTAIPFFACGYCARKYTNLLFPNKWDNWLIPIALICFVITWLFSYSSPVYRLNSYNGSILATYSGGMFGTFFVLFVSKFLKHIPYVSWLGKYSIMILVTHQFLMLCLSR